MAKRRPKTSPIEDVVSLVALLPWWACLGAALLSYVVLARLARPVVLTGIQPGQMAPVMTHALIQALATVGQFVVPILCLAAAAVSVAKRQRRSRLVAGVAQSRAPDALDRMSWQEFELLVGEAFRLQGYEVTELGGEGPDGGVDLVLRKGKEKFLVQCKQWKAFKVGVAVVRELYGVMAAKGAAGGFVVTSGSFTDEAIAFASGRNHARRRAEAVRVDPASEGGSGQQGEGGSTGPAASGDTVCAKRSCVGDPLPDLLGRHGATDCKAWRQRRQGVLGLRRLPNVPRHQTARRAGPAKEPREFARLITERQRCRPGFR